MLLNFLLRGWSCFSLCSSASELLVLVVIIAVEFNLVIFFC